MKKITINTNQSKEYKSLHEAIINNGFQEVEEHEEYLNGFKNIYEKDGNYYGFIEGNYLNTTAHNITLLEVDNMESFKEYYINEILKTLKDELLNKTVTLKELNNQCRSISDESVDIFDYSKDDFIHENSGSFVWGSTPEQKGAFEVEFDIIVDNEDIDKIVVKVVDVSII